MSISLSLQLVKQKERKKMKDRGYENRYKGDDVASRLISIIKLLIFISVTLAFVLGILITRYFQSPSDPPVPRRTVIPAARQERILLYPGPEGSRLVLEGESLPRN